MIRIDFTEEDKQKLHYLRFHHPDPKVQLKMEVLWLKSQGLAHKDIIRLAGISENTLRSYLRAYVAGGLERLQQLPEHAPKSALHEHRATIETSFREHPPHSIKEAQARIEELTGIKRSPTQVRHFLHFIGMKCRKVGFVPGKGGAEQAATQKTFHDHELQPRLEEARQGRRSLFFRGCRPFRPPAFPGLSLVLRACVPAFALWS